MMFVLIWVVLSCVKDNTEATGNPNSGCPDYCLNLTKTEITAEAGLCAVILCSFTTAADFNVRSINWYKCKSADMTETCDKPDRATAIFNSSHEDITSEFRGRVSLFSSDLNCSIIINDLKESDSGSYQLRVGGIKDKETNGYTFIPRVNITVTGLSQKPTVTVPPLTEGQQATLTCTAPGLCSGSAPKITWTWRKTGDITGNVTDFKTENLTAVTQRHSSTLTFGPSAEHHGSEVTCKVSFSSNVTTEKTVTLKVDYSLPGLLTNINWPRDIIVFLSGMLLSAIIICSTRICRKGKRSSQNLTENMEMMTGATPLDDTKEELGDEGAAAASGQSAPHGDVEYSEIDFSVLKRRPRETKETHETETEFSGIKSK